MTEKAMLQMIKRMENKLRELMSEEDYKHFSTKLANEAFAIDIDELPDGDFKTFCQDHFLEIIGEAQKMEG